MLKNCVYLNLCYIHIYDRPLDKERVILVKELCALRGKFSPHWSQKLKVAFHQFHPIGLLEERPKCKILAFILLLPLLW